MTADRVTPGRVLLAVYALFVVAAGARSVVQLATHASRAPLAYALSLVAAVVYAAGFVLVRSVEGGAAPAPLLACSVVELLGVVGVGAVSVAVPSAFPDATVWSWFGAGYLFIPLALPVAVLVYLRSRHNAARAARGSVTMDRWPSR